MASLLATVGLALQMCRAKLVQGQDPPSGSKLRSPDYIQLENVRIACPRIEPLHVELVLLVGGVGVFALLRGVVLPQEVAVAVFDDRWSGSGFRLPRVGSQ